LEEGGEVAPAENVAEDLEIHMKARGGKL